MKSSIHSASASRPQDMTPADRKRSREEQDVDADDVWAQNPSTINNSSTKRRCFDRDLKVLRAIPEIQNYHRDRHSGRRGTSIKDQCFLVTTC